MITLGTARLHADDATHDVFVAITWERGHAWAGILGGDLDWPDLAHRELELEVPGPLGPTDQPVVTDVAIDALLDNDVEVRARGAVTTWGAHPRHLSWHAPV
jgi:hypothetical protein